MPRVGHEDVLLSEGLISGRIGRERGGNRLGSRQAASQSSSLMEKAPESSSVAFQSRDESRGAQGSRINPTSAPEDVLPEDWRWRLY